MTSAALDTIVSSTTLADKARASLTGPLGGISERAFMLGALSTLELIIDQKRTPGELLAECVQYGRTIGTAAEAAS